MSIILAIESYLNREHIRLSILRDLSSDSIITNLFSFHKDSILWISESYPEVAAIILRALEVLSNDVNCLIIRTLYWPISWSD
jgi:hypothetical protein